MWSLSTENNILVKSRFIFWCSIQVVCGKQQTKKLMVEKRFNFYLKKEQTFSEYIVDSVWKIVANFARS